VTALIVDLAQYALFVLAAVAGVVWLTLHRAGKVRLAAEAVVGLAVVGAGIVLAAHLHTDPRPFVHDPASRPLFSHAADNGFPSDHSAAVGLLAVLVARYKRGLGIATAVGGVLVAAARVAAHVHHVQDVVAGLLIGAAAGARAIWLVGRLLRAARRRGLPTGARALTTADRTQRSGPTAAEEGYREVA
jgi:membrane-associated phospholipid phosphatase